MNFNEMLSSHPGGLFWDVDSSALDPRVHSKFIIRRIVERGELDEVRAACKFYGEAAFREALLEARDLGERTVAFFANQFGVPVEDFRSNRRNALEWSR